MYYDQYVLASLALVAIMVVASVWSVKKLKNIMDQDEANAKKT
ncbi:hypothetical protein SAMN05660443_1882 [Marinospirillum celere]|uniref:Heme exporter protein D n=1 Tax=Marinospirillum celere TaxID=1122252 RepID=A0A1I1HGH8_9GAMM|nr:hypothetical protein [Marinospirillum celere]SFC20573.1 hypothetical protein SAMN05660443_1882 [Marinospirillum celere]